jgi:Sir2 family
MSHHHHHHRAQPPFRFSCNTTTTTTITDAPPVSLPQHQHPTNEEEDTIPKDNEKPIAAVVSSTLPTTVFRQGWQLVLQLLQGRQQIAILTGAGMSVSCGIPDFRSQGSGLYATLDTHVRYIIVVVVVVIVCHSIGNASVCVCVCVDFFGGFL